MLLILQFTHTQTHTYNALRDHRNSPLAVYLELDALPLRLGTTSLATDSY